MNSDTVAPFDVKDQSVEYDTDVENFWSNPNNFAVNGDFSGETLKQMKNVEYQKTIVMCFVFFSILNEILLFKF